MLLERDNPDPRLEEIRKLCEENDVKIEEGSRTDVWRMALPAQDGEPEHPLALALVGRQPNLTLQQPHFQAEVPNKFQISFRLTQ